MKLKKLSFNKILELKNFKKIELPQVVQSKDILKRSGETFRKNMFSFYDKKNLTEWALRPDMTICSAILMKNIKKRKKIYYEGNSYQMPLDKIKSPIKRQQGFEIFYSKNKHLDDKEILETSLKILKNSNFKKKVVLKLNNIEIFDALINRLGFNNDGMKIIKDRIKSEKKQGILGINIGPNKDTNDQKNDFCLGLKFFFDIADYITVNISSPNTEGLRDFHDQEKLKDLLLALNKIKKEDETKIPLLLKVSPDIKDNHISEIADVATKNDISAIILTNTTNGHRDNLTSEIKKEEGGLSGEPLQKISTNMIKKFYKQLHGKIPIIGVGGVNSGKSAYEKIRAGASLLQLYTGLVYKGPSIVKNIKKELIQILKAEGLNNIREAVGKGL